jgi:phage shock protein A
MDNSLATHLGDFIQWLFLGVIAWVRVKPFLKEQAKLLKEEMAGQMNAVREEISGISKSVERLSDNLSSLESAQTKRFERIEDRIENIEVKLTISKEQ